MTATYRPAVFLEQWQCPVMGERWSLSREPGRHTLLTYGTEAEARAAAERHGWTIDEQSGERGALG